MKLPNLKMLLKKKKKLLFRLRHASSHKRQHFQNQSCFQSSDVLILLPFLEKYKYMETKVCNNWYKVHLQNQEGFYKCRHLYDET